MNCDFLSSFLSKLSDMLEGAPVSPAFWERFNVTQSVLRGHPKLARRSVASPYFVTDLGVRKFDDPAIFYIEHLKLSMVEDEFSTAGIYELLDEVEMEALADFIDAVILFTGNYSSVAGWISGNVERLVARADYRCLINAGTVVAAMANSLALPLFDQASKLASNVNDAYSAQHRAAAFEIKKLHQPQNGIIRLEKFARILGEAQPTARVQLDLALLSNLKALADIEGGTGQESDSLRQAEEKLEILNENLRVSDSSIYSRGVRYRSQIAINRAQIEVSSGNYPEACRILSCNVDDARSGAYDYLSEALGEYAYALFLNNEFDKSLRTANEAFWHNYYIGGIAGMRMVRDIGIASLYKMGELGKAEELCTVAENDVLGSKGYGI